MTAFQFFTYVDQESIPADGVVETFKNLQDDLFSGIAEIFIDGACFYAIFVQGRIRILYHTRPKMERIDPHQWLDHLPRIGSDMLIRSINFPARDLRIIKILLEANEDSAVSNISPKKVIEKLAAINTSSIVFLEDEIKTLLFTISGNHFKQPEGLVLTPEAVKEIDLPELLALLPETTPGMKVITIDPADPGSAWIEQQAHEVFVFATQKLIQRYGSMRERVYLNKIIRAINFKADANDRMIFVNARDINDQEIFDSPIHATQAYREMMKLVLDPIKKDLGEHVYANISSEIQRELTRFQQKLFDQMVSE